MFWVRFPWRVRARDGGVELRVPRGAVELCGWLWRSGGVVPAVRILWGLVRVLVRRLFRLSA